MPKQRVELRQRVELVERLEHARLSPLFPPPPSLLLAPPTAEHFALKFVKILRRKVLFLCPTDGDASNCN